MSHEGWGSLPQEDKPVSVWRVWTFQPYPPVRLVSASNTQQHSITRHLTCFCSTRRDSSQKRRCPQARRRTRSQMGNPLSSWDMNVSWRESCLRIQISLPRTPLSSSARKFLSTLNGRGPRYVSTEHSYTQKSSWNLLDAHVLFMNFKILSDFSMFHLTIIWWFFHTLKKCMFTIQIHLH